jgi:ankyrin repeat protein
VNKTRPEDNQTALHLASAAGHAEVVLYLLQQPEIYPPAPDKDRKRASDLAAASGHQEVVEMLAAADAVFHSAEVSQAGKLPELKKNLARWPELANAASGGDTALLQASRRQNAEVIACLIEHGADVNAQGKSGDTPLHIWATLGTKKEIGELLLSAGADVNAKNKEGKTPIFGAAGPRVLLLLDNGADVNVVARGGISLLHSAAFSDSVSPEALEAILAKATDVNVKDETGRTALSYCKDEKKRAIFLKHGAKE